MAVLGGATFRDVIILNRTGTAAAGVILQSVSGMKGYFWIATDGIARLGSAMLTNPNIVDINNNTALGTTNNAGFGIDPVPSVNIRREGQTIFGGEDSFDTIPVLGSIASVGFPGIIGFTGSDGFVRYCWITTAGIFMTGSRFSNIKTNPNSAAVGPPSRMVGGTATGFNDKDTVPVRPNVTLLGSPDHNGNIIALIPPLGLPSALGFTDSNGVSWYMWMRNDGQLFVGSETNLNSPESQGSSVGTQS